MSIKRISAISIRKLAMFVEGVKDSHYHVKNMIMKVTPVFINSNWIPDDYRQAFQ